MIRNRAASIRARLKQHADTTRQDFNLMLTHYGLERLLYRLSVSEYRQNFLLKGALLFVLWYDIPPRSTRDADLLGFGADDIGSVENVFRNLWDGLKPLDPKMVCCRRRWPMRSSRVDPDRRAGSGLAVSNRSVRVCARWKQTWLRQQSDQTSRSARVRATRPAGPSGDL